MNNTLVFTILIVVFVLAAGLNVYVASALRARAPGLARRGYLSAAAFAVGVLSLLARHAGLTTLSFICIGVMVVLFFFGIMQKGVLPKR
ncbi:MAG: hypothetical protein KGM44_13735 [bacterium]|nr:hypothetical protein [bacterium]